MHRLGFTSNENVVQMKGRVACEINSADELLITEMMFAGIFNDITASQAVALMSCFAFQEKVSKNNTYMQNGPHVRSSDSFSSFASLFLFPFFPFVSGGRKHQAEGGARTAAAADAGACTQDCDSFKRVQVGSGRRRIRAEV